MATKYLYLLNALIGFVLFGGAGWLFHWTLGSWQLWLVVFPILVVIVFADIWFTYDWREGR